jgi:hypothetical protein
MRIGRIATHGLISLGALCAATAPAAAKSTDLGVIAPGSDIGAGSFWLGTGVHEDDYSFTIADLDTSSISLLRVNNGLANFVTSLYRNGSLIQSIGVLPSGLADTTDLGKLGGGSYSLLFSATPASTQPGIPTTFGFYALALSSTAATPAPGPAGWLVAGAGIALVGFAYRRRTMKVTTTA